MRPDEMLISEKTVENLKRISDAPPLPRCGRTAVSSDGVFD